MTAFTEPPYDEDPEASRASFFDRVARYSSAKPDFRLMLAWNQTEVLGLALGAGTPSGDWWRENIIAQLTPDDAEEWFDEKTFAVVELATSASHRRSGIASALLSSLLEDIPYSTAVLSAYSEADDAQRFYRGQGWTLIAAGVHIGESPELCVFGMHLNDSTRE